MPERFRARLKELRLRAGLTQQKLAGRARLSVSTVARLEQGGRPAPQTLAALARALGVRVETLTPSAKEEPDPAGE